MVGFLKVTTHKAPAGSSKINPYAESAAKSGNGGGSSKLPKGSHTVGATGDHVAGSSGSNSGLPKYTTKVGITGDSVPK